MSSGIRNTQGQASGSSRLSDHHSSSSQESFESTQKRRRKAGDLKPLTGASSQTASSSMSLQPAIRPRSTVPILSASAGPNTATRYRPILPAPVVPVRQKQEPTFIHGPTNLPPEPYRGEHPYVQRAAPLNIHRTAAERLPRLEARINRLENAVEKYIDHRSSQALERSNLPRTTTSINDGGSAGSSHKHSNSSSSTSSSR